MGIQAGVGTVVSIYITQQRYIHGEVVGFDGPVTLVMPYENADGIRPEAKVSIEKHQHTIFPHASWKGHIFDALGTPLNNPKHILHGPTGYSLKEPNCPPEKRKPLENLLETGIRSIDLFSPICEGQRIGIFAGAGVGKTTLLRQIMRHSSADTLVIGLIGERGREVNEFLAEIDDFGILKKSVVVAATSDTPALMRKSAAFLAVTLASFFRDQGENVLCLIDSITRFAFAQREIGLAAGEPPTVRGYPPSTFSELHKLLERIGNSDTDGSMSGILNVLVEGNDLDEPISDAVRSTIDGDIILDKDIALSGRFPAVDILKSFSRKTPKGIEKQTPVMQKAKKLLADYKKTSELIEIGAYQRGNSREMDEALDIAPAIEDFLSQKTTTKGCRPQDFETLNKIVQKKIKTAS